MARFWVLGYSDGRHGLFDIAERAGLPFRAVEAAARELEAHGLLLERKPS
jgi:aminopeptidase-like protein